MQTSFLADAGSWPARRDEALRRMRAFVPRAGRAYAAQRNFDRGPTERDNVSTLSPYIRQRVITETEVLETVLANASLSAAEKFVQEVFWRTYWKGWLQSHPAAWSRYRQSLNERIAELDTNAQRRAAYDDAVSGRTGIDAFDAWSSELVRENYLHNHARMWFASIWIFTLALPWELGADFFMRNLLDGDPASNTLSWRWVAGLQTRGKTYLATPGNIHRYTDGRFALDKPLARSAAALDDAAIPLAGMPEVPAAALTDEPSLLVLHEDDLHGDLRELPIAGVRGITAIRATHRRSPAPLHPAVIAFSNGLGGEAVTRAAAFASARAFDPIDAAGASAGIGSLSAAAAACGATRIIAPFAPIGPARDVLDDIRVAADGAALHYAEFGRRYDAASWPAATRGFFNLRSRIPTIIAELGIGAG